jgi:two-component system sensor histidine kinase/response regulator
MRTKALQVLLVEDNAGDARLLREMFSKETVGSFELSHLTHMREAEVRLKAGGVDIVLLDMGLPDGHGLETLRRARAAAPDVVMIVLTGMEDEALAAAAMKEGAQDYLIKGQIENRALPRALRHAIERQRMQRETDLMRKNEVELRDQFLSHVSHELRSPLTSIYSFSTIIADGLAGETSPQQNDYLQIILRNVRQLQSMIEDLLQVTQAQAHKLSVELESVSLNEAIEYAVDTLRGAAKEKEINLAFEPSGRLPSIHADATRVRQLLTILLDNAVKFTPAGGTVKIEVSEYEKDESMVQIQVSDTGCGIGPEAMERIFEHLYQVTDPGHAGRRGLGLGLHIAKDLVTRQGGKIWVTSELETGSHFFFTLPVFSLAGVIRPILTHEKSAGDSLALIKAEVECRDGSPDIPRKVLDLARSVLQQSLRADSDVLLPGIGPFCEHKRFFVVANTLQDGAESIGRRIQSQLRRHHEFQSDSFTFNISHSFLPSLIRDANESMESFAEEVASEVRDQINNVCLQGAN